MDLVKVHEGHIRILEAELAAHKTAAAQAVQQELAMTRQHEAISLQAKQLSAKAEAAQNELSEKSRERAEVQAQVGSYHYTKVVKSCNIGFSLRFLGVWVTKAFSATKPK